MDESEGHEKHKDITDHEDMKTSKETEEALGGAGRSESGLMMYVIVVLVVYMGI